MLLQQCLPFTVLKLGTGGILGNLLGELQQCLPFTVLKHNLPYGLPTIHTVATVLTVYGIETLAASNCKSYRACCNSAYRLRY